MGESEVHNNGIERPNGEPETVTPFVAHPERQSSLFSDLHAGQIIGSRQQNSKGRLHPILSDTIINVFISYTTREEEVVKLQPATDAYCDILLQWGRERGVDIFYDRSSIPQYRIYSDAELRDILRAGVTRSHILVSFLSPAYIDSEWCRFEFETKAQTSPREIHKVYWKPEIEAPLFMTLARLFRPTRTRFLMDVLQWDRIRHGDRWHWRDTRFRELISEDNTGCSSATTLEKKKGQTSDQLWIA